MGTPSGAITFASATSVDFQQKLYYFLFLDLTGALVDKWESATHGQQVSSVLITLVQPNMMM